MTTIPRHRELRDPVPASPTGPADVALPPRVAPRLVVELCQEATVAVASYYRHFAFPLPKRRPRARQDPRRLPIRGIVVIG